MITIKIDVTKISKDKLYKGQKGTYLDAVLIETPNSEFGDYMIVENTSKEEREKGVKGVILGNAKVLKFESNKAEKPNTDVIENEEPNDDLPF